MHLRGSQLQVKVAVPAICLLDDVAGRVAVTVTAEAVACMHVAVPNVASAVLLMLTWAASETDQVTSGRLAPAAPHPFGPCPKAKN